MMKKAMLVMLFMVGCAGNNALGILDESCNDKDIEQNVIDEQVCEEIPYMFNILRGTRIAGNDLFDWVHLSGYQKHPCPDFEKITVVKLKKNGSYDTQFQLKDIRKAIDKGPCGRNASENKIFEQRDKFQRYANAHNAIECFDLIELPNKDGELKPITVVIYGTQNGRHCELYKAYHIKSILEQQEQQKQQKYQEQQEKEKQQREEQAFWESYHQ
jgi:hypothetical protein